MWKKIKDKLFGAAPAPAPAPASAPGFGPPRPDLSHVPPSWIEAADSPFGVRVLDVRPVTLGTLSYTGDAQMARNAVSYGGEDGAAFAGQRPPTARTVAAALRFRAPDGVHDGSLFVPREMEDKWAVFVHDRALLLVRSWRRAVLLRAPMTADADGVVIGPLEGFVTSEDEPGDYTRRAVDFILRTYALGLDWPAPLLGGPDSAPEPLGLQCMSVFGRHALVASLDEPPRTTPDRPLRVMTRLHYAAIRGDLDAARRALADGVPVGLRDGFGRGAILYVREPGPLLDCLRAAGATLDDAAEDGTTLLMYATQDRRVAAVEALLAMGARADAADARGFTALHRAAEMGEVAIARALLARGADPGRVAAGGNTPRSLAAKRGEAAVLALFG